MYKYEKYAKSTTCHYRFKQDDLAKKIGVSRQTINSIEKNRYAPSCLYKIS
ncbi:helix-turn-helix domain-containing protein [Polaribacter batillariae]|uniref:Helix-turn-helix domain-containing protein n=1 Tax=Polaribacter batillariae TaxID=2808900 RepID=A0ABX7T0J3_9FLAO|nr:helix-turn-helix domain-containing protein [Polaribacter batillariae]